MRKIDKDLVNLNQENLKLFKQNQRLIRKLSGDYVLISPNLSGLSRGFMYMNIRGQFFYINRHYTGDLIEEFPDVADIKFVIKASGGTVKISKKGKELWDFSKIKGEEISEPFTPKIKK